VFRFDDRYKEWEKRIWNKSKSKACVFVSRARWLEIIRKFMKIIRDVIKMVYKIYFYYNF